MDREQIKADEILNEIVDGFRKIGFTNIDINRISYEIGFNDLEGTPWALNLTIDSDGVKDA
jgi:hypothetical protein